MVVDGNIKLFDPSSPNDSLESINEKLNDNQTSFALGDLSNTTFWISAATLYVHKSNKIENINHTISETSKIIQDLTHEKKSDDKKKKEVVQHYKALCDVFKKRNEPLSVEMIKEWHAILMNGAMPNPGQFRQQEVITGNKLFIEYKSIPSLLETLVNKYNLFVQKEAREHINNRSKQTPYSLAAWISHAFLTIHPFLDGNGRISRLLENYVLFEFGFPFPIPAFDNKEDYLGALRQADRDFKNGRNTSQLAHLILNGSNKIYTMYLANNALKQELKNDVRASTEVKDIPYPSYDFYYNENSNMVKASYKSMETKYSTILLLENVVYYQRLK
ncbi:hypothetical protein DICPUDRAFT_149905 [Dictyostelium purpureum]|uniref:Fido domain-containing protein n=1 Tax=Dictyostelium purpureum TaxID=5786 RepID=F0ZEY6_DICPU|nr:uncharacterized protein DICPUDRAFT_149905 [Dictyostelium purpureum]EGC37511.1 hypothetical protein DICPUDRAFT_149905 [Dictyostelium purpureum]|eukprot:XP_003285985.1 hypothetical protein DICPUDRAFT_149905 [Dictyostelium purpureum]